MKHIVIAATPAAGHFNPMMAIAEHLAANGYRITVLTGSIYRERVQAAGFHFVLLPGKADFDLCRQDVYFPERSSVEPGLAQITYDMQHVFGDAIADQYAALKALLAGGVDMILADLLFLGTFPLLMGLPRESRPPIVSCGIVPIMCRNAAVSPFAGPSASPEGLLRNAEHNAQLAGALQPATDYVSDCIEACCGKRLDTFLFDELYLRPDLFLQFTTQAFEYPMVDLPRNLVFVGPIVPKHEDTETPVWIDDLDPEKPVVFITQGTVANYDLTQLLQPALDGLADEPVQVVATAGGVDPGRLRVPPNARVESYLSYAAILPRTAVFVTNGGYNGVQMALRAGIPIVSAGASEDKPFVSARVEWSGCGLDLKTGTPTATQVRDAVRTILSNPGYRAKAQTLACAFEGCDALRNSLRAVEGLLVNSNVAEELAMI
ncbi:glycosyltransferase [Terriglobus tenax]|uniref:glycosyltransferase n=1 Tax=Terriglobus tenax TaxID=1111115 RepID=UPI0021DF5065|nr:nucleotide disphospho-sugar-binding domain-containing protein [Terriglobus tenax]